MFVYELSGCEFESRWSHLNCRYCTCFEQGVPWHSDNCRVWIHSETHTWHDKNIWPVWRHGWVFVLELSGCGFESHCNHLNFKYRSCFRQEFCDIHATIECRFTLKYLHDMTRTYSSMYHIDKYSHHSSIIWHDWLNFWMFVYELSGCGFESRCSHLNFRY